MCCLGKLWSELQVKAVLEGSKMFDCGDGHIVRTQIVGSHYTFWQSERIPINKGRFQVLDDT